MIIIERTAFRWMPKYTDRHLKWLGVSVNHFRCTLQDIIRQSLSNGAQAQLAALDWERQNSTVH